MDQDLVFLDLACSLAFFLKSPRSLRSTHGRDDVGFMSLCGMSLWISSVMAVWNLSHRAWVQTPSL